MLQVCAAPKRRFGTYSGPKGGNTKAAMDDRYAKLQSGSLSAGGSGCELMLYLRSLLLQYERWLSCSHSTLAERFGVIYHHRASGSTVAAITGAGLVGLAGLYFFLQNQY